MPLDKAAGQELSATIALARKIELPFGLCMGKVPENTVLVTNRKKSPEILAKQAKKEGETPQVTFGLMTVSGSTMTLVLHGKSLPSLSKRLRAFLTAAGLTMKVEVLIPEEDGADPAAQGEDAATAPQPQEAVEAVAPDEHASKWEKTQRQINDALTRASSDPKVDLERINEAWQKVQVIANQGNYAAALKQCPKVVNALKAALNTAPAVKPSPAQAKWVAISAKIEGRVKAAVDGKSADYANIQKVWEGAKQHAASSPPDYTAALKETQKVALLLKAASKPVQDAPPSGVKAQPKPDPSVAQVAKKSANPKRDLPSWRLGGDDNVDVMYANADGKIDGGVVEGTIGLGMVNMSHAGNFGDSVFGGSHDLEAFSAKAEGHVGVGKGIGAKAKAEARVVKESASLFIGSDENNPIAEVGAEYELLTAEAKGDILIGSDGKRAGLALGGSASATVAKADAKGAISLPIPFTDSWTIEFSAKGGGQAGGVAVGGEAHAIHDFETGRTHVGAGAEIAAFLGVAFDFDISVGPAYKSRERSNGP